LETPWWREVQQMQSKGQVGGNNKLIRNYHKPLFDTPPCVLIGHAVFPYYISTAIRYLCIPKHTFDPHLSSNKAGSSGQADHGPAGAKSGPQFYCDFTSDPVPYIGQFPKPPRRLFSSSPSNSSNSPLYGSILS